MNQERTPSLLALGYECLKNADLGGAARFFDEALHKDFDDAEVLFALKCAEFWQGCMEETKLLASPLAKGDMLIARWKNFRIFLSRIFGDFERATYAFKRMAFSAALEFFLAIPDAEKEAMGPEFDFRAGRCRKALGDYETALQHFERAVKAKKDEARFLAELADCHGLAGEQRMSKLLFREAFFVAPDKIDIDLLESDMIGKLVEKAKEREPSPREIAEWIPVYGEITGLFDVKRELGPSESSRLNSSMFQLENDSRENSAAAARLKPRLINRYFWLIDHYEASGADGARKEKVLLKIRLLDEAIYKQYVS